MLPGDFKRKYRYKTDPTKERKLFNWILWVSILLVIIIWYFTK